MGAFAALDYFLKSSSIAGLSHVSNEKHVSRLFWIFAVASSFLTSVYLINQSFQMWSESPVTTLIETLPSSKLSFPKISVCPPKYTDTNLNADIVSSDGKELTKEQRKYLLQFVEESLLNLMFDETMSKVNFLMEERKYYNFYHGYSELDRTSQTDMKYRLYFNTIATEGTVYSRNFGRTVSSIENETENMIWIYINIIVPEEVRSSENITLTINLEWDPITDISKGYERISIDFKTINPQKGHKFFNFSSTRDNILIIFDRDIETQELSQKNLTLVPGFKLQWQYSQEVLPVHKFKDSDRYPKHESLKMLVNLIHFSGRPFEEVWEVVKMTRSRILKNPLTKCKYEFSFFESKIMNEINNILLEEFSANATQDYIDILDSIALNEGVHMFYYLYSCPNPKQMEFLTFFSNLIENGPPNVALLTLNRILLTLEAGREYDITESLRNKLLESTKKEKILNKGIITNHPVHILGVNSINFSISSFIPFCEFGGNMSVMGKKIENFDLPVCTSFQPIILNDQLCYEVGLNQYRHLVDTSDLLKNGLVLLVDNNEDRHKVLKVELHQEREFSMNLINNFESHSEKNKIMIYINTIGIKRNKYGILSE